MNPRIKEEWIAALRSGDYRQTTGFLNRGDGSFCCLGVLCEIARSHGALNEPEESTQFHERPMAYNGEALELPGVVRTWAGVESGVGELPTDPEIETPMSLAEANDDGWTFQEIANLIEEYL